MLASPLSSVIARFIVLVAVACTAFLLLFQSARFGAANVVSYAVDYSLSRWHSDHAARRAAEQHDIDNTDQLIQSLLTLHPGHPHYLSLATSVYIWKSIFEPSNRAQYLQKAEELSLQAHSQRPTWVPTMSVLAKISYYQGENPAYWLNQTYVNGQHLTDTYLSHVEIGFASWDQISGPQKAASVQYLLKGMENRRLQRLYAPVIKVSPQHDRICRFLAATGQHERGPCDD